MFELDWFVNEAIKLHNSKQCLISSMIGYDTLLMELYCDDTLYLDESTQQKLSSAYHLLEDDIHDQLELLNEKIK